MEFIVILVLISILGAVMVVRFDSRERIAVPTHADLLRGAIAHAQNLAISRSLALRVKATSTGISVCLSSASTCDAGSAIVDPATGNSFVLAFSDGVTMSISGSPSALIGSQLDFDSSGRPVSGSTAIGDNPVASYQLRDPGNTRTATVIVRPVTGFAEVSY